MNEMAIIYDDIFLSHDTGNHPENSARLIHMLRSINHSPVAQYLRWFKPEPATVEEVESVHSHEMVESVKDLCQKGGGKLDPNTWVSAKSYEAALTAAGCGKTALDLVFNHGYKRVFIPCRPPGHHATSSRSMGFCIFNNGAICAKLALKQGVARRIAIIDWDAHHGNGTEEIFYTDNRVLYLSVHQNSSFPGTGLAWDRGIGRGEGYNINVPLPEGSGDNEYLKVFNDIFKPEIKKFSPDLIIVSAGFDGHRLDPLSNHNLSSEGFRLMAKAVRNMAKDSPAQGKIIAFLEGGHHIEALAESVVAMLRAWLPYDRKEEGEQPVESHLVW